MGNLNTDAMGNNDTFHICKCLGKSFTYDEYTDFVKGESSSHTVFEYDGFKFNAWDVCLNPNMALEWQGKSCKFKVKTAKSPNGRWDGLSTEVDAMQLVSLTDKMASLQKRNACMMP